MPRSSQTKELLASSLQELMLTMPLEKISVNDIVEKAGVGRNTFYYHFEDKFDLVNWYFQKGVVSFLVNSNSYSSWESMLSAMETYFRENRQFYTRALQYTGQNCLMDYMFDFFSSYFRQRIKEVVPDMNEQDLAVSGNFLSGAFLGLLIPWVNSGMKNSISEHQRCLELLSSGRLSSLLFNSKPPTETRQRKETSASAPAAPNLL